MVLLSFHILVRVLLIALPFLAVSALDQRRLKLTITSDLQRETRADVIRQAIHVVRQRVTAFTSQAAVILRSPDELHVELPGLPPAKLALIKKLMQRSGRMIHGDY